MSRVDQWTIALLGESGIGKTALAVTFALDTECGASLSSHVWSGPVNLCPGMPEPDPPLRKQFIVDNRMCFVELLDSATGQVAEPHQYQFIAEGDGFVLAYSITSRSSFDHVEAFHEAVKRVKGANAVLILVGNKYDERSEREVSREDGATLARQLGCEFIETSAKTGQNVGRTFTGIVRALRQTKAAESPPAPTPFPIPLKGKKRQKCIIF
ncbi:hypothetical protein MVEN_01892500 [Mycena venus]|uniref:Ras protein n=1 Tax=Mycena venus TaxID=2733690 RepID=A0A8H7CN99_9AGAR|nr:hypothetical protein MVEN_01892500 [Mycena venus]